MFHMQSFLPLPRVIMGLHGLLWFCFFARRLRCFCLGESKLHQNLSTASFRFRFKHEPCFVFAGASAGAVQTSPATTPLAQARRLRYHMRTLFKLSAKDLNFHVNNRRLSLGESYVEGLDIRARVPGDKRASIICYMVRGEDGAID